MDTARRVKTENPPKSIYVRTGVAQNLARQRLRPDTATQVRHISSERSNLFVEKAVACAKKAKSNKKGRDESVNCC